MYIVVVFFGIENNILFVSKDEAIRLSSAITSRLGYSERNGETFMDGLLRMYVLTFLCNIGHSQCLSAAKENFSNWKNGGL